MKQDIHIGELSVGPAKKMYGYMQVSRRPDGSWVTIPVVIVNGAEDGPRLWLQAGCHGEEVAGTFCVTEIVNGLDPNKLRGAVIGIPVVNTPALMASNFSTVGQRLTPGDFKNLNRVFPGDPNGSLSDQIADRLFTEIKKWADVLIDVHDGGWALNEAPLVIFPKTGNPEFNRKQRDLARSLLLDIVWVTTASLPGAGGALGDACFKAAELGIPSLMLELSGSYNYPEGYEYSVGGRVKGILNAMRFLEMIGGKVENGKKQKMIVDAWFRCVKHGGFLHYKVELGEIVTKGQVIAEVKDIFNREVVDTFVCPFENGLIAVRRSHPAVNPGDWVVNIGQVVEDEEKLLYRS